MATPGEIIASLRSCSGRQEIGVKLRTPSSAVTRHSVRHVKGSGSCRHGTLSMAFWAVFRRPVSGHFPQWMAAAAQAFSDCIESWVAQDFATFLARSHEGSAQSWATIHDTIVRNPHGHEEPWLKVFLGHPAAGSIMGWPSDVLLVVQRRSAPSWFWRWPPCWAWENCGCMTGSCGGSSRWQRSKGAWRS